MTLDEIFSPLPSARFLLQYFNAAPCHATGDAGRFATLHAASVALQLERELEAPVSVSERPPEPSREVHRGEQDVIALHLSGNARWRVFGNGEEAAPDAAFDEVAQPGSAIYIPRGWWRSCESGVSGSFQLEFQIRNPTAVEFLEWLTAKMKDLALFQTDLQRFAAPGAQAAYVRSLRRAVSGAFRAPGLMEAFGRRLNRLAPAHPVEPDPDRIVLATPRIPMIYRHDPETLYVSVAGQDHYFPTAAAPLLQYVIDRAPVAVSDFYFQFQREFDSEELAGFLAALEVRGVIAPVNAGAMSR